MKYTTVVACSFAVLLPSAPADAAPFATKTATCGTVECGEMVIDKYGEPRKDTASADKNLWSGGITIEGAFAQHAKYLPELHYLQAVLVDDSPSTHWSFDFVNRLDAPYVDAPPFGYATFRDASGQRLVRDIQDVKPWYDNPLNPRPAFIDKPGDFLLLSKNVRDSLLTIAFETWIVCVIAETFSDDNDTKNDAWTVAPLLGWTWGLSIKYDDVGQAGVDEADDFTVRALEFAWIDAPSNGWKQSLTRVYKTDRENERFDISLGVCEDCRPTPEPSTLLMLLGAGAAAWTSRYRRRSRGRTPVAPQPRPAPTRRWRAGARARMRPYDRE